MCLPSQADAIHQICCQVVNIEVVLVERALREVEGDAHMAEPAHNVTLSLQHHVAHGSNDSFAFLKRINVCYYFGLGTAQDSLTLQKNTELVNCKDNCGVVFLSTLIADVGMNKQCSFGRTDSIFALNHVSER